MRSDLTYIIKFIIGVIVFIVLHQIMWHLIN